jgi:SHS2 domain-containing protein
MFEVFEHTADLGLRIRADSLEKLLAEAARGLFSLVVVNLEEIRPVLSRTVEVDYSPGNGRDYLLFDWLNELLFLLDSEQLLLSDFQVGLSERKLSAVCRGETMDRGRHQLDHEVKAITYHGLRCEQTSDGWIAEVIVDI